MTGRPNNKVVSASTVRDVHKLLRNAFQIMPDDPRAQEAITAVYMLYMDEQKADQSDEITS